MLENSITWLAFCISSQFTKSIVHIFPSAGSIAAPYQVRFSLTLLRTGERPRTIMADGVKLGQPDGFRFDQVFPESANISTPQAVLLEVSTAQAKVDLSTSDCVIEFASQNSSIKYRPQRLVEEVVSLAPFIAYRNSDLITSIVTVNAMDAVTRFSIQRMVEEGEVTSDKYWELVNFEVPAHGILEYQLSDLPYMKQKKVIESGQAGLFLKSGCIGVTHYLINRDIKTHRLVSVTNLCGVA